MTVYQYQRTLAAPVHFEGVGVHSGKTARLTIKPAPVNHGIKFVRTDLPGQPAVTGHFNRVVDTSLATVLGEEGCIVSTVEHVMATLSGLAIDNALVDVDTYELPILDGSAGPYTHAIRSAGIVTQEGPRCYFVVTAPIEINANGKKVGVSVKPGTDVSELGSVLDKVDMVLVMTVEPGFGGQSFMGDMLAKVKEIRKNFKGYIQVDGGINKETAGKAVEAGVDVLVAGTAVFGQQDYGKAIRELRGKDI